MFYFLFRLLGGLVAAAVAFFGVLVVAAAAFRGARPEGAGAAWLVLATLAAALVAFVWMFRRLGRGKWADWHARGQIEKLKRQATRRNIAPHATLVASALGGGTYATATLRASLSGDNVQVDAAEGGAWRTVFSGRYHAEVQGQVVAGGIHENPNYVKVPKAFPQTDRYVISTKRVGHQPAWWEVLAYIPGTWEEELDRLLDAAKQAKLAGEKDRFGL